MHLARSRTFVMLRSDVPGVITCVDLERAAEYIREHGLLPEALPAEPSVPDDWQDLTATDWKQLKTLLP